MSQKDTLYNLTYPQQSIYYTEQLYKGKPIANISGTAFIEEKINIEYLQKAINILVKENEALRTKIKINGRNPIQYYSEYEEFECEKIEVKNRKELEKIIKKLLSEPFEKENEYLFRATIFKFSNGKGGFNIISSHLICDAWSETLMCNQIMDNYIKLIKGELSENERSMYKDYILEEQEYLLSEKFNKDAQFWKEKINELPELVSTNQNSIEMLNCTANRVTYELTEKESKIIYDYCEKNKISIFNFFLTIYAIYLSRITGIEKVTLGTPVLNRKDFKQKNTIGMFINTIPIILDLSQNKKMIDVFDDTTKEIFSVFRHQRYPYMKLLKYIREKYNINRGLYDVILSYQNAKSTSNVSEIPYSTKWDFNGNISETLNIHISDIDSTNKLKIYYDYQIDKHTSSDIQDIHNRIIYIIKQVIKEKEILLDDIDIVPQAEKKIINKLNTLEANYEESKTICDLFEEQAIKTPNKVAVSINGETITYEELNKKANSLAYTLIEKGVIKNTPVGLRINKSIEMIIGIIAIIKAGGCYLPIDLSYPEERISFMLKDSKAKILLTNKQSNIFKLDCCNIIELDNIVNYNTNIENLNINILPEDLLYIIYTSGSTGIPKGVMITHKNVVRLLKNDNFLFDFNSNDVWSMFHSVAFDFSVWEMYGALLYGGKLVLIPEDISKNPKQLLQLLRKEKITILNQTPTFFYNLLENEIKLADNDLNIRYIIFGGEALKPNLIKDWNIKYPKTKLINMYGITETTVHVTYKELNETDFKSSVSNIGKPIPTLKVYVLDNKQRMLPIGIEGEMCVFGDGVCKGYLNREELNKEKFIENPYEKGKIMYRTSDSAILNKNCELEYKGRIDNQVKIRGFRIELGEIETKLLKHPNVEKCVVLENKTSDKDSHLVAYVVCNKNIKIDDLKLYMKELVPTYMIPNHFVKIDDIPVNSNGKVDRKYLKNLKYTIERDNEYKPARNKFERTLKNIIEKEMQIKKIGIDDDIFDLGADSLTLMRITANLLEKNYEVNIQKFYEQKTIRGISDSLKNEKKDNEVLKNEIYFDFNENVSQKKIQINNVLLTGATGFLGIHILNDLINNTKANIYCLIRDRDNTDGFTRLKNKIKFYYNDNDNITKELDKRIKVVKGDITKELLGLSETEYKELGYKIDVLIHSAAIVNHYGSEEKFKLINIIGTKNVIEFCKKYNVKLNHISTTSVSADFIADNKLIKEFNEHSLYIKQPYEKNIYIKTKFEAEYCIWKEKNNGLQFAIYRLGNITSRLSDGKFQENDYQNAFLNRILSIIKIGTVTKELLEYEFDMSPVDICSKFITEIMQFQTSYNKVFHILNSNKINLKNVLNILKIDNIKVMNNSDFVKSVISSKEKMGLINDITNGSVLNSNVKINSEFTNNYLKNLNLTWKNIDEKYIRNYLKKYIKLGE